MKFFIPKSYQLAENKKWIPSADIIKGSHITKEYSVRKKEFNTKEEADRFITEFCIKKGMQIANMENKIYKCKKCSKILRPKEIDLNLEFSKGVRVVSNKDDVTHIPLGGIHKGCGGKVITEELEK